MKTFRRPLLFFALVAAVSFASYTSGWFSYYLSVTEPQLFEHDTLLVPEDEDWKIQLNVTNICGVGELVRIDLRKSTVATTLVVVTIPDLLATEDFEIIEEGRRAFFSSRVPGEFLVIVAGAKNDKPYLLYQRISVEGDGDTPSPIVVSLSTKVAGWVRKVEAYEQRNAHGLALVGVFTRLSDSSDVAIDDMLEATALANSAVLGSDLSKWEGFLDGLGTTLDDYLNADQLSTREDYRQVWKQIAKGIRRGL